MIESIDCNLNRQGVNHRRHFVFVVTFPFVVFIRKTSRALNLNAHRRNGTQKAETNALYGIIHLKISDCLKS